MDADHVGIHSSTSHHQLAMIGSVQTHPVNLVANSAAKKRRRHFIRDGTAMRCDKARHKVQAAQNPPFHRGFSRIDLKIVDLCCGECARHPMNMGCVTVLCIPRHDRIARRRGMRGARRKPVAAQLFSFIK
jgi:hypothetical protein